MHSKKNLTKYVLITPAKNEEKKICKTISSVITQTVRPTEWVIVSDSSTDRTEELVKSYCKQYKFIRLIRNESSAGKDFSSKVNAFNKGLQELETKDYSFIGNLDADVSFDPDYFENIISLMQNKSRLGIAGGLVYEVFDGKIKPMRTSFNSVAGAVQFFRRNCFEGIGGYIPIKMGGIDSAAEICARAKGWDVMTFSHLKVLHQGRVLTGKLNPLQTMFQMGLSHYMLGYHPLFHLASSVYRLWQPPILAGALSFLFGYLAGFWRKQEIVLPKEVVEYLREEQILRLRKIFGAGNV